MMKFKKQILYSAIVSLIGPATLASGDDFGFEEEAAPVKVALNSMELGLGYVSDDNGKFGEFSRDLTDQGFFGVGAIHLENERVQIDLDKGLYNSSGSASYGVPGQFSVKLYGADSQKTEMFNAYLPKSYDADLADLGNYMPVTFEVKRTTLGVEMNRYLGNNWLLNLDYNRQIKEGDKTMAGPDHGPVVSRTVDFEHDELTFGLEYWLNNLSLGASYYLSDFTDKDEAFSWDNGAFEGTIAAEPDSEFSRFELDGSYRIGQMTALNWITSWSEASQNDPFVSSDAGLPDSLHGEVNRFYGRLSLTSRLSRNFNYKLEYAVQDREADHDVWDLDYRRNNSIYGKESDTIKVEGGYRLPNRSKIRFGWKQEDIERSREDITDIWIDKTQEDTLWVDYRFAPIGKLNLTAKYENADRDGNQGQNPDWIAPYNTDRSLDRFRLNGNILLTDQLVLSGGYTWSDEDFSNGSTWVPAQTPNELYGLDSRQSEMANVGLTYSPSRDLNFTLYGVWQTFDWEQFAHKYNTGRAPREEDKWVAQGKDETVVVGVNLSWQVNTKLGLSADIGVSESEGDLASYGFYTALNSDGSPVDPGQVDVAYDEALPVYGSDSVRVNIKASWQHSEDLSSYIRYVFEKWDTKDYGWDGELQEEMYFAWHAPDEVEHAIILGVKKAF